MLVVLVVSVSMANQYRMNFLGQETQVLHAKTKKGKCALSKKLGVEFTSKPQTIGKGMLSMVVAE